MAVDDGSGIGFKSEVATFLLSKGIKGYGLKAGRMFDYHVLDMVELGIEKFNSLRDFKNSKSAEGSKPMLIFAGDAFEIDNDLKRLKNLFIDFFRGPTVPKIRLAGLEIVLHFTAFAGKIFMRSY
eukprot:g45511.t1